MSNEYKDWLADTMIQSALAIASLYHRNQKRKYTGEPYIEHPKLVAKIITDYMEACDDIVYDDYKKICKNIHCFDYLRDIVTNKGGEVLERNDVKNDRLWDTSKIKYLG